MEYTNDNNILNTNTANFNGINYYSIEHPESGKRALAMFNRHSNAFFGNLLEYSGYSCIMNYQDIVKKKKVYSWAKFVPMNKILVVQIEDVDTVKKIVQVSMAYLADNVKEELSRTQLQEKLMKPFTENKIFESFINSVCIVNSYEFNNIWTTLVHHIDKLRRELDDDDDDDMVSLYQYFVSNINDIDKWIKHCNLDESVGIAINTLYQKRIKEYPKKITSKIGIISLGGVNATKQLISNILPQLNCTYNIRYDTAPYYLFETSTKDSNIESHNKFISALETESIKFTPKIFVKANFIGKISAN
jgi:translation initiation factor 2 alpha subunit (eIF-2alpha)